MIKNYGLLKFVVVYVLAALFVCSNLAEAADPYDPAMTLNIDPAKTEFLWSSSIGKGFMRWRQGDRYYCTTFVQWELKGQIDQAFTLLKAQPGKWVGSAPVYLVLSAKLQPLSAAELAQCQVGLPVVNYTVVYNSQRADGARPMKSLLVPTQPYSQSNPLLNMNNADGTPAYIAAGAACDPAVVVLSTSAGIWLYTTNDRGTRGIALCRQQPTQ